MIALIGGYSFFAGPIRSDTTSLGTQGDFFGGHVAASVGTLTLAIVIYTSYRQSLQQDRHFSRQYFIQGADLITSAMRDKDMISAMRFIEYYSRLALSKNDGELYLILNAVLFGDVRKQLESDDKNILNNYPYSVLAMKEIGALRLSLAEQSDPPKSRIGRFLMVSLLAATSVIAGVRLDSCRDVYG